MTCDLYALAGWRTPHCLSWKKTQNRVRNRLVARLRARKRVDFNAHVSYLIIVVSILSSIASWRAAVAATDASDLSEQATRETVQIQQRISDLNSWIEHDQRLFVPYSSHVSAWKMLDRQSIEAQKQIALARSLSQFFQAANFTVPYDATHHLTYDRGYVLDYLKSSDELLGELRDVASASHAGEARGSARGLVVVVVAFATSLVFLTFARSRGALIAADHLPRAYRGGARALRVPRLLAGAGIAVGLVASAFFVLFETRPP